MVALQEWFLEFPGMIVHHVNSTTSDHKMLWIDQAYLEFKQKKKKKDLRKYGLQIRVVGK